MSSVFSSIFLWHFFCECPSWHLDYKVPLYFNLYSKLGNLICKLYSSVCFFLFGCHNMFEADDNIMLYHKSFVDCKHFLSALFYLHYACLCAFTSPHQVTLFHPVITWKATIAFLIMSLLYLIILVPGSTYKFLYGSIC